MSKNTEKPLMANIETMAPGALSDELYAIAYHIERTLIDSGATPGKDYSHLDLIKLAQPFVLDMFKDEKTKITYTYPAESIVEPQV